jgi:hypothetical protein
VVAFPPVASALYRASTLPKRNRVTQSKKKFRDRFAVDARSVSRVEIFELLTLADEEQLRVTAGDRWIIDLDRVVGRASDGDPFFRQFVGRLGIADNDREFRHRC